MIVVYMVTEEKLCLSLKLFKVVQRERVSRGR